MASTRLVFIEIQIASLIMCFIVCIQHNIHLDEAYKYNILKFTIPVTLYTLFTTTLMIK